MIRTLVVGILIWTGIFAPSARADILKRRISLETWGNEFVSLCVSLQAVCGIEIDHSLHKKNTRPLELHDVSGREALDAVLARYPGHQWELRDGVLIVHPKQRKEKSPLETHLTDVDFKEQPLPLISKFFMQKMRVRGGSKSLGGSRDTTLEDTRPINLRAKNISVRDALTRVVKTHKSSMWIFTRYISSSGEAVYSLDLHSFTPTLDNSHKPDERHRQVE